MKFLLVSLSFLVFGLGVCCAQPNCTIRDCAAVLDAQIQRLPLACGVNASTTVCQKEVDDQLRAIVPVDAEQVWQTRSEAFFEAFVACNRLKDLASNLSTGRSESAGFSCGDLVYRREDARYLAASTPGSYAAVTAMAFNISIRAEVRDTLQLRRVTCVVRELQHLRRLRAACQPGATTCASVLDMRILGHVFDARLCRLEIIVMPFSLHSRSQPGASVRRQYLSRVCNQSDVPNQMCDAELWIPLLNVDKFNSSVYSVLDRLVEPVDDNSIFMSLLRRIVADDDADLQNGSGRCFFQACQNGTVMRINRISDLFSGESPNLDPWTSLTRANLLEFRSCWFRCAVRTNIDKQMRLARRQLDFMKDDLFSQSQLWCPPFDSVCIETFSSMRAALRKDNKLAFALGSTGTFYAQTVSADPGIVVTGLALSSTSAALSLFFLIWGWSAWHVKHARVLLVICFGTFLSSLLRIVWWVSYTEAAEAWTQVDMYGWNPYISNSVTMIVQFWADALIFLVLTGIFSFVLDYWIDALAFLIDADEKHGPLLVVKRWVLVGFACAVAAAGVGFAFYVAVVFPSVVRRAWVSEYWTCLERMVIMQQALSVAALSVAALVVVISCVGLGLIEPRHKMAVAKTIVLFSLVTIGAVFRVVWTFSRSATLLFGDPAAIMFPVCYIVGDTLIFIGLLGFSVIGLVALLWQRNYSDDLEKPLLERSNEDENDIPLAYQ